MKKLTVGNLTLESPVVLAPMAGVTDRPFRLLCREQGAGLAYTEMVSSRGISRDDGKSIDLALIHPDEGLTAVQIFGNKPDEMADAAKKLCLLPGAALIDINMGCPAPKIVKNGDGSALMKNISLAGDIISAVCEASSIPVTVKFRLGWDENSINCIEFGRMAERCGAAAVCLHARTKQQAYSGSADHSYTAKLAAQLNIPLIANGDISDPVAAEKLMAQTGAAGIMIGRAALGDPWIFSRFEAYFSRGELLPPADIEQRIAAIKRQTCMAAEIKGEYKACLEARKHFAWYLKGLRGASAMRTLVNTISSLEELDKAAQEIRIKFGQEQEKINTADI